MTERLAYSISEVADYLGVARTEVMRLVNTGRLHVLFIGSQCRIPTTEVNRFIAENTKPHKQKSRRGCNPDGSHYTPELTR